MPIENIVILVSVSKEVLITIFFLVVLIDNPVKTLSYL